MKEHQKYYFDTHPKSNEVFETADENLFHEDHAAKAHARNLDNKTVVRIARPEASDEMAKEVVQTATVTVPTKGVDAIAPVVAEQDGTVISPGVGETSTSPVAAPQVVDEDTGKVIDPGTVDVNAKMGTVVTVEKPMTTDVPEEAPVELTASKAAEKAEKAAAKKAEKAAAKAKE